MAMPKKGVRKITVNGKVYKYLVKPSGTEYGCWPIELAKVTIESPEGKYFMDQEEKACITPSYVKELISLHLAKGD